LIAIGLTGGIGSGKSAVAALLAAKGAAVVDADEIARAVVAPGGRAYDEVVQRFGDRVVNGDGSIDRGALAAIVFSDEDARRELNAVVHPAVGAVMGERIAAAAAADNEVVVLDIPLLVEAGGRSRYEVAGVLVVDAPLDIARERLVTQRGMTEAEVSARMAAQATREQRLAVADFVIMNMGTMAELAAMTERAWDWIQQLRQVA
jgi:dephospho-CoA kinase